MVSHGGEGALICDMEDFKHGLFSRFGPNQFEDPFSELIKLYQTGSVLEYQGKFEKLLAKAGPLTQDLQVSFFPH